MKVAIMQPYIFPYLGYFQLVNSVDKFIFYDDVKFQEGKIIAASPMNGTKRFLNLKVKANGKEYQLVSRIGKLYENPSDLLDKVVVFVEHNMAPELRKSTNQGMIIVQENAKGELELIDKSALPDLLLVAK